MFVLAVVFTLLQGPGPDTVRAGAYLDETARELVRGARERRAHVDRSLDGYRVLARERISVGLRALRRDRMIYRRELAARVHWTRAGGRRVELLGARQVIPLAQPEPHVPDDARDEALDLAFDPAERSILQGFENDDGDGLRHPLSDGSEAEYRFATGDTTRIRLPSGREVRLIELRVIPRRATGLLVRGSLWLDADSHAAVRGVFRLARPLDVFRDLEEDEDIPGILQPIEADLRYLTIEYGLWEDRWWLPRVVAIEGEARMGRLLRVPVRFERAYEAYEIDGTETVALAEAETPRDASDSRVEGDTVRERRVEVAPDSVLLRSELLPPSIYDPASGVISPDELSELLAVLGSGPGSTTPWRRPEVSVAALRPGLVRYNRVEGLAVAARVEVDAGPVRADATGWIGSADREPAGELGLERVGYASHQRVAVYRRLAAVAPDARALRTGSSLSALLLGRDDSDYYRALGAELTGASAAGATRYRWRLFAERQSAAERSTHFSLARALDADRGFHENIDAAAADQAGVEAALYWARGLDPRGVRWGGEVGVAAATGDFAWVRPSASAHLGFPLPGRFVGALEVAGGAAYGEAPAQALWYLGGPATVRGYGGPSRVSGPAFWRARAELGTSFPGARLAFFSDAGWAGERSALTLDPRLLSAGAGIGVLDGLLRVDLSRALLGPTGWRLDLYLDGIL